MEQCHQRLAYGIHVEWHRLQRRFLRYWWLATPAATATANRMGQPGLRSGWQLADDHARCGQLIRWLPGSEHRALRVDKGDRYNMDCQLGDGHRAEPSRGPGQRHRGREWCNQQRGSVYCDQHYTGATGLYRKLNLVYRPRQSLWRLRRAASQPGLAELHRAQRPG